MQRIVNHRLEAFHNENCTCLLSDVDTKKIINQLLYTFYVVDEKIVWLFNQEQTPSLLIFILLKHMHKISIMITH